MSFARRYGGQGQRRKGRVARGKRTFLPWEGVGGDPILALDANLGVLTDVSDNVTQWSDQTQTQTTQFTPAGAPLYTTLGGLNAIRFDSASLESLENNSFVGATANAYTKFIVASHASLALGVWQCFLGDSHLAGSDQQLYYSKGATNNWFYRTNLSDLTGTASDTAVHVHEIVHQSADRFAFLDGTQVASQVLVRTVTQPTIVRVGRFISGGGWLNGYVHSVIWFNSALSAAKRSTVRKRLGERWGVTVV